MLPVAAAETPEAAAGLAERFEAFLSQGPALQAEGAAPEAPIPAA
jgi:hypothetical protein